MHYFHLMRTLKYKNLNFFALKMANNTLILQIVVDFISKVPIFKLFSRFWRGLFCLKMFPSSKKSKVPFRGGVIAFQKVPKFKKVPSRVGGGGGHRHLGIFPKFRRFLILKAPLTVSIQFNVLLLKLLPYIVFCYKLYSFRSQQVSTGYK